MEDALVEAGKGKSTSNETTSDQSMSDQSISNQAMNNEVTSVEVKVATLAFVVVDSLKLFLSNNRSGGPHL